MALPVEITEAARADLDDVALYTMQQWSMGQAEEYLTRLLDEILELGSQPRSRQLVLRGDDDRPEIRRALIPHSKPRFRVYFEIHSDRVVVLRVYHVARDLSG